MMLNGGAKPHLRGVMVLFFCRRSQVSHRYVTPGDGQQSSLLQVLLI